MNMKYDLLGMLTKKKKGKRRSVSFAEGIVTNCELQEYENRVSVRIVMNSTNSIALC